MFLRFLAWATFYIMAKNNRFEAAGQTNNQSSAGSPNEETQNVLTLESWNSEPYINIRIKLEDLADQEGLYKGSESKNDEILGKLYQNKEAKNLIKRCKIFQENPICNLHHQYRSSDGRCNNLKYTRWGASDGKVIRLLPAHYEGIRHPTSNLPGPRDISVKLTNEHNYSDKVSAFFTFFGQVIVHDMTLSPMQSLHANIPCCQPSYKNHPACELDIHIRTDDPFFSKFNVTCVPFRRSAPYPSCDFSKRSQINKVSSFLDATFIYGYNDTLSSNLRANDNTGRLFKQRTQYGDILPANSNVREMLCPFNQTTSCFKTGDERVNQHVMLTCLETMFLRLHNKIAVELSALNPHWNGEKIYQESRRIVIAVFQHMIYNEYLPVLIGKDNMLKHDLFVNGESLYNENVEPNILSEFNTAAFRLHSMVPEDVSKYFKKAQMRNIFSFSEPLHNGTWSTLVAGSCENPSEQNDQFIITDLRDYLYRPQGADYGFDIAATNIQRGRDHGLPPYVDVVERCFKFKIKHFSDLFDRMIPDNVQLLRKLYRSVEDIDLWIGMIMEKPAKGALLGPTANCIASIQFNLVKFGDTFFFSHTNGRYPFTGKQLHFIHGYSASRFLCDTLDFPLVRKKPLLLPNKDNPLVECVKLPQLDLSSWIEWSPY